MKFFILLIIVIGPLNLYARGGDEILNGGGLAENYLHYALRNLNSAIEACLLKKDCYVSEDSQKILLDIKKSLPEEIALDVLKFESENKKPGLFKINGLNRLAVTGSTIGSPIYYNLDLIYGKKGQPLLSYRQAIQSLVHELGHHHGIKDHDKLEILGAAVGRTVEGFYSEVPFLPHYEGKGFFALSLDHNSFDGDGALAFFFNERVVDITPEFFPLKKICTTRAFGETLQGSAVQFFNLRWSWSADYKDPAETYEVRPLEGNAIVNCRYKTREDRHFFDFRVLLSTESKFSKGLRSFVYLSHKFNDVPKYLFMEINPILAKKK